ncbi:MAG: hypothetical protein MHPSP_003259, partial [Paramarteilia canceri]
KVKLVQSFGSSKGKRIMSNKLTTLNSSISDFTDAEQAVLQNSLNQTSTSFSDLNASYSSDTDQNCDFYIRHNEKALLVKDSILLEESTLYTSVDNKFSD